MVERDLEKVFLEMNRRRRLATVLNITGVGLIIAFLAVINLFPAVRLWQLWAGFLILAIPHTLVQLKLNRCPICERSLVRAVDSAYCPHCGGRLRA